MKKKAGNNYLECIPKHSSAVKWSAAVSGDVTIDIENKGAFNRMAQLILKKPRVSHVHLDKEGSYVWLLIDGRRDIEGIGRLMSEKFGEKAQPLYERLTRYIAMLEQYGFINVL